MRCDPQMKLCHPIQKSCPNDCSGHGKCSFFSPYNPNVSLSECSLLDLNCVSRCQCVNGYSGESCSMSQEELLLVQQVRSSLLESASHMMSLENPDRSSVVSWVRLLSMIATDYSQLSDDSKLLLVTLCERVLVLASHLSLSIEELSVSGIERVIEVSLSTSSNEGNEMALSFNSLLQRYNEFVFGDMVQGQQSVTTVTSLFRFSSVYVSSSDSTTSMSTKLSSPLTSLESFVTSQAATTSSSSSPSSSSFSFSSNVSTAFPMALIETFPQTVISSDSFNNVSELSNVLSGTLYGSPCLANEDEESCVVRVELVSRERNRTDNHPKGNQTSFEVNCTEGSPVDHVFVCPTGQELVIHCNGSMTGIGRRMCPVYSPSAQCKSILHMGSSALELSCQLVSYHQSSTLCDCIFKKHLSSRSLQSLSSSSSPSSSSSSADADAGNTSPVQFSVQSVGVSVVTEFVSTWEVAATLSPTSVRKSLTVLLTVSCIGLLFLITILLTIGFDDRDKRRTQNEEELKKTENSIIGITSSATVRRKHFSRLGTKVKSKSILDHSLPAVFKSESLWNKFKQEVKVYHRWLGIVFHYSPEFPRAMRALSLFSSIVIMLFIQSVTYNIADPDDGSCEACEEQSCCLSLKSSLNRNEARCYWSASIDSNLNQTQAQGDSSSLGSCHMREIGGDMTRVFIVALLSALISAPFALLTQYIVMNILSLETEAGTSSIGIPSRTRSIRSKAVIEIDNLSEEIGDSLSSDFQRLLSDLQSYSQHLREEAEQASHSQTIATASPLTSEDLLFAWGLFEREGNDIPQPINLLKTLGSSERSSSAAQTNLLKELSVIRKEVGREYQWFKEGAERVFVDKSACLDAKRRRLLYLFVKDLSSGVCGDVLGNKDKRDRVMADKVSLEVKVLGWLFVALLNLGMLVYVYLFAMSQTESRQVAWFQSFVVWFLFDLFVASTGAVFVTHLLIPLYILSDIRTIKKKVMDDIAMFRERQQRQSQQPQQQQQQRGQGNASLVSQQTATLPFNSAKFLFTSYRIAALCPEIPESAMILEFHTPWPKKNFKQTKKTISSSYDRRYSFVTQAISRVLIFFLTSFIHFPVAIQDLFIQLATTSGLGYLIVFLLDLADIHPLLPLLPIIILGILIHFLTEASRVRIAPDQQGNNPSHIFPLSLPPAVDQPLPQSQPPVVPTDVPPASPRTRQDSDPFIEECHSWDGDEEGDDLREEEAESSSFSEMSEVVWESDEDS